MSSPITTETRDTKLTRIRLTYDEKTGKVTKHPSTVYLKVNELVEFYSDQGPVTIQLPADEYEPDTYHTGSEPVRVLKVVPHSMIKCAVFSKYGATADYHGNPKNAWSGAEFNP